MAKRVLSALKIILGIVMAGLALGAALTIVDIRHYQVSLAKIADYSMGWPVSQAIGELYKFETAVNLYASKPPLTDIDGVQLRLDILKNRHSILNDGVVKIFTDTDPEMKKVVSDFGTALLDIQKILEHPNATGVQHKIRERLVPVNEELTRLAAAAYQFNTTLVSSNVNTMVQLQTRFIIYSFGLILGCVFLAVILILQNRVIYQQIDELREMDQLKDQFLANTSHELRTPLNSIIGLAENIIEGLDGPINELQRKHLDIITQGGYRLLEQVGSILDYSKLKAGKVATNLQKLNFREFLVNRSISIIDDWQENNGLLISKVRGQNTPLAKNSQHLRILANIPTDLPEMNTDSALLQQILNNLLSNALKFTAQGSITIFANAAGNGYVEIGVRDTGIGIPPEAIDKVFNDFYQVDGSERRQAGGTGLGLSVTKKLVEALGGTIRLESQLGVGSTFLFTIPCMPGSEKIQARAATLESNLPEVKSSNILCPVPEAPATVTVHKKSSAEAKTIFLIDDEPNNIEVLKTRLESQGYKVISFESAMPAYEHMSRIKPDLIISDVMMPGVTGYDLCRIVRNSRSLVNVPFIFASAKVQPENKAKGMELGANGYLEKPISFTALSDCLQSFLPEQRAEVKRPSAATAHVVDLRGDGETILIIDDEPANIEVLKTKLESRGFKVVPFLAALEALEYLNHHSCDLVISDVMMPGVSGYDFCAELRQREDFKLTPVILLTAKQQTEDIIHGLTIGADDYLTKPFNSDELFARVKTHLRMAKLQQQYQVKVRMQHELEHAGWVQKMLLPTTLPALLEDNCCVWYEPLSEAGGDFYGYLELKNSNECLFYVGDVTGHGVNAALVTAYAVSYFSILQQHYEANQDSRAFEPEQIVINLNRHLYNLGKGQQTMTFLAAVYNQKERTFRFSSASHPPPLVVRNGKLVQFEEGPHSQFLGHEAETECSKTTVQLEQGDLIFLYTDGLTELQNEGNNFFGERGITRALKKMGEVAVRDIPENLAAEITTFRGSTPLKDDITLIGFKA